MYRARKVTTNDPPYYADCTVIEGPGLWCWRVPEGGDPDECVLWFERAHTAGRDSLAAELRALLAVRS